MFIAFEPNVFSGDNCISSGCDGGGGNGSSSSITNNNNNLTEFKK
jgi:hypothetical protein